jgi:uncharacterized protein (TIGR02996 family)
VSEQAAILAAICADPEDDTPRLAYADWLDERGRREDHLRAAFIRAQIELARMPEDDENPDAALRRAEAELRVVEPREGSARWRSWTAPFCRLPRSSGVTGRSIQLGFVRGFPAYAFAGPALFLKLGAALFEVGPMHRLHGGILVAYEFSPESDDLFLASPLVRRLRRISLTADGTHAEKFFSAPNLNKLEELGIHSGRYLRAGSPVRDRTLTSLRSFTLFGTGLHPAMCPSTPPDLPRVAELLPPRIKLREFGMTAGGTPAVQATRDLAALAPFRRLEQLTINSPSYGQALGAKAIRNIAASPFWRHLRRLTIANFGFGDVAARALAEAPPAPNLRTLNVPVHNLTARGIAALAASPVLRTVTTLQIDCGQGIGDEGATRLAQSPHLGNLSSLDIAYSRVSDAGLKAMADAPWAANLVRLNYRDNGLGKPGLSLLTDPNRFPRLRLLGFQRVVRLEESKAKLMARYGAGVRFEF